MDVFIISQYSAVPDMALWRGKRLMCVYLSWGVDGGGLQFIMGCFGISSPCTDGCVLLQSCVHSVVQTELRFSKQSASKGKSKHV